VATKISRVSQFARSTLLLLIAVGIGLRFYNVGLHSLWGDEMATWRECWQSDFAHFWHQYFFLELTPPLYFLCEFLVARLVSASEWSMRFLSLIFGIGFVVAGGFFAYELSGRKRLAALAGAAFVATSYRAILISREARAYSLLFFLSALSGWAWLRVQFDARSFRLTKSWPYIAIGILLSNTHYFGVLMVLAQALTALFLGSFSRQRIRNWLLIHGLIFLGFVPTLLILAARHMYLPVTVFPPPLSEVFVAHRELFGSSSINSILALLLAVVAIVSAQAIERRKRILVLVWVFLVFFLAWGIAWFKPIYSTRYFMVVLAPMLAIAAVGAAEIYRKARVLSVLAMVLFCVLGLFEMIVGRQYFARPQQEQIREATMAAAQNLRQYPNAALSVVAFSKFTTDLYMQQDGVKRRFRFQIPSAKELNDRKAWPQDMRDAPQVIALIFTYDDRDFERIYAHLPEGVSLIHREDFYHVSTAVFANAPYVPLRAPLKTGR